MIEQEDRDRMAVRAVMLLAFILLLFGGVVYRYLDLMVLRHDEFRAVAEDQRTRAQRLRGVRGTIRDRNGRILALTRAIPSVAVDPSLTEGEDEIVLAHRLAAVLEMDEAEVRKRLERPGRFAWLRRRIRDEKVLARLPEIRRHRAVVVKEELTRCYPAAPVGSHFVGCTRMADPETGATKGVTGIELALESYLRASCGSREVLRDGRSGTVRVADPAELKCRDGMDVELAMDLTIQTFAETALDEACAEWQPQLASVVVMDPRTGDVLALASRPGYDPHDLKTADPLSLFAVPVENGFEIGSVMKPLVVAAALNEAVVPYNELIDCTSDGAYRLPNGRVLHDYKPMGVLSVPDVLVFSSNIGTAKIARMLGDADLYRYVRAYGFGEKTGCGLPSEAPGGGAANPEHKWTEDYTLPSVSIGHEILVTPLQFATAFSALANGGYVYRPRVVVRLGDRELAPAPLRHPVDSKVTRELIVPALERVVTEGTGKRAQIAGYRVAGKSGTAEVKVQGVKVGYTSSFVAFAPAEAPRFLVYVLLHMPRTDGEKPGGGQAAAPCVRRILELCLGYTEVPRGESRGAYGQAVPSGHQ